MPSAKKNDAVIVICIQEPFEDGSSMDFGAIKGDEVRFLHQAFITDTLSSALEIENTDVRLLCVESDERNKLVKIVLDYLGKKLTGKKAIAFKQRFESGNMSLERWGIRIEKVFQGCFKDGYKNVIVVGSRTPTVTAAQLRTALKMLRDSDAVFGPTPEGRYYLIGMSDSYRIMLSDFDWKSPDIYREVKQAFDAKKLVCTELEIWYAVEKSDDLETLARDINQYRFEGDDVTARETELVLERILTRLES